MSRKPNTTKFGETFSSQLKLAVWVKANKVPGKDPLYIRKDVCGALIQWEKYGDTTENAYGWEIDHIDPVSNGGGDNLDNLQALQWQNNRSKADHHKDSHYCVVSSK